MSNLESFKKIYNEIYNEIDIKLNDFNKKIVNDDIGVVRENMDFFSNLNSGGKLIRGFLINLGYKIIKDDYRYSIPLSVAFEVFQTAVLVHDDIIDNDDLRRGKPTIHKANFDKYKDMVNDDNSNRKNASSLALCAGDLGLFHSSNIIVENYNEDKNLAKILNYYNKIVMNTIRGEMLDVYLPFAEKYHLGISDLEDNIMKIYELKTAWYTIIGPLVLGMILADSTEDKINDIKKFAYNIGVAFQIQDDILGIYSNNLKLGKVVGSDIQEFKQTILYSYVINSDYKDELLKYYGKDDLNNDDINSVKNIINESGALEYAKNKMNELFNKSKEILDNIDWLRDEDKQILHGLLEYLDKREK